MATHGIRRSIGNTIKKNIGLKQKSYILNTSRFLAVKYPPFLEYQISCSYVAYLNPMLFVVLCVKLIYSWVALIQRYSVLIMISVIYTRRMPCLEQKMMIPTKNLYFIVEFWKRFTLSVFCFFFFFLLLFFC